MTQRPQSQICRNAKELADGGAAFIAERLARLEAQVATGERDARTLGLIPRELAMRPKLTFPADAFGLAETW